MKNPDYDVFMFDLGRVLVDFDHSISARKMTSFTDKDQNWLHQFFFESELTRQFEEGKILPKEFYIQLKKILNFNIDYKKFVTIWVDIFMEKKEMNKFAAVLKKNYRLLVISNINILHFEYIKKKFPVISLMDKMVLSYEIGAIKPDKKIYRAAINASNTRPERIIYTDDREELVESGKKAGIKSSFVFRNLIQFKSQLKEAGIII